ncbi:hypothetical protein HAX54_052872, partial [Datura stramonium]|nr:hypothetical protein [Datura stramonium]
LVGGPYPSNLGSSTTMVGMVSKNFSFLTYDDRSIVDWLSVNLRAIQHGKHMLLSDVEDRKRTWLPIDTSRFHHGGKGPSGPLAESVTRCDGAQMSSPKL